MYYNMNKFSPYFAYMFSNLKAQYSSQTVVPDFVGYIMTPCVRPSSTCPYSYVTLINLNTLNLFFFTHFFAKLSNNHIICWGFPCFNPRKVLSKSSLVTQGPNLSSSAPSACRVSSFSCRFHT